MPVVLLPEEAALAIQRGWLRLTVQDQSPPTEHNERSLTDFDAGAPPIHASHPPEPLSTHETGDASIAAKRPRLDNGVHPTVPRDDRPGLPIDCGGGAGWLSARAHHGRRVGGGGGVGGCGSGGAGQGADPAVPGAARLRPANGGGGGGRPAAAAAGRGKHRTVRAGRRDGDRREGRGEGGRGGASSLGARSSLSPPPACPRLDRPRARATPGRRAARAHSYGGVCKCVCMLGGGAGTSARARICVWGGRGRVFADLWERGYWVTSGEWGCDTGDVTQGT